MISEARSNQCWEKEKVGSEEEEKGFVLLAMQRHPSLMCLDEAVIWPLANSHLVPTNEEKWGIKQRN